MGEGSQESNVTEPPLSGSICKHHLRQLSMTIGVVLDKRRLMAKAKSNASAGHVVGSYPGIRRVCAYCNVCNSLVENIAAFKTCRHTGSFEFRDFSAAQHLRRRAEGKRQPRCLPGSAN